jgi:metal-dependent amidase/aminoacylase/carboxypeptidase family protein
MPDRLVDPVVMAASAIMKLQTIVSREVNPWDPAVVTVASVQAGDAENVVVDDAKIAVDVRATKPETREQIKKSIKRIVDAEALSGNAVKPPTYVTTRAYPLTTNSDSVTAKLEESFSQHFAVSKEGYTTEGPRIGGSEDFSILGTAVDRPCSFWVYGGTDPELWDACEREGTLGEKIPINHSGLFAPAIMPTLRVGCDAYAVAALTWLGKE